MKSPSPRKITAESVASAARPLPSAIGPEKSILSTMMREPQTYIDAARVGGLVRRDFFLPAHAELYSVLVELDRAGRPIELVSLTSLLDDRKLLAKLGGPGELAALYACAPTAAHFHHHLRIVRAKAILRKIIAAGTKAISGAFEDPADVADYLDECEKRILQIREEAETNPERELKDILVDVNVSLAGRIKNRGKLKGLASGFPDLDAKTGGIQPGWLFVVAARPGMGKTSFLMNLVEHVVVEQKKNAMVFSLEMTAEQLVERMLCSRARFPAGRLKKSGFTPTKNELKRLLEVTEELSGVGLYVDDTPAITIGELRAKARRKKREAGLDLIAVDYLQLMKSKSEQAKNSREREIAEISGDLKALSKELKVPVIALAQLNRKPEERSDGSPRMSDLRESGAIEQDADLIGLLYRSAYYGEAGGKKEADKRGRRTAAAPPPDDGSAELLLAKNRHGSGGPVPLTFLEDFVRFVSRARGED